jgi:hypothetical protein
MTRRLHNSLAFLASINILIGVSGCSSDDGTPELGQVTGSIKLDGQPLANARVEFHPTDHEQGRVSFGTTDSEGNYELKYSLRATGAMLGKHEVRITTEGTGTEYSADGSEIAAKQKVPAVYNVKSELTAEVKPGSQEIDFLDLESKGEIIVNDDAAF